jgi:U3 small nucleolar RNA-associated protein 4
VIIPGKAVGEEYQYSISGLPQYPPVASSTAAGVFACWWGNEVRVWRLGWNFHKLVARIVVKGDENICDAVLSTDGALLAVVSAAGLRIFRLSLGQDRQPTVVKRLATIAGLGGKLATFSSDSKWLAVISHSNKVKLFSTRQNAEGGLESESFVEVGRINRDSDVRLGGSLGNYWRTVNRVGFSPDGKMLVASDISGYLDCWTVAEALPPTNGNAKHGDTDSSDDDTDSDDEAAAQIDGWEWRRSEAAESLPRLDSAPIVLSFRPRTGPEDGYRLLVLSAKHSIFEFSLSAGSFTDWSRRNPTEVLPDKFKDTRDRAMGSFWGTDGWWWIYGAAWVFGVDTTVDHTSNADASKKRKRDLGGSGATNAVKRREQMALVRAQEKEAVVKKAPKDEEGSGDQDGAPSAGGNEDGTAPPKEERERHKWFMTFKYRPILGIVPVAAKQGYQVQVALIERPVWDLNLPPRFESVHRGR